MKHNEQNSKTVAQRMAEFVASLPADGVLTLEQLEKLQELARQLDISRPQQVMLASVPVRLETDDADNTAEPPIYNGKAVYDDGVASGFKITRIALDPEFVSSAKEFLAAKAQQQSLAA